MNNMDKDGIDPSTETPDQMEAPSPDRTDWFSIGFYGIIVFLVLLSTVFLFEKPQNEEEANTTIKHFNDELDKMMTQEQRKILTMINEPIDKGVDAAFRRVYENIPAYADIQYKWYRDYVVAYYKAQPTISNLLEASKQFVLKLLGFEPNVNTAAHHQAKSYAQKSAAELQKVLLGDGALDRALNQLHIEMNHHVAQLLEQSNSELDAFIRQQGDKVKDPDVLAQLETIRHTLDTRLKSAQTVLKHSSEIGRMGAAGLAAALTGKLTAKLLAKSGVKAVAKGGAKAIGFWGGAASGTALCSPAGPWALACGAAAGTLTWIGVDFVFSEADERLTRDAFEAKLRQEIRNAQEEYRRSLKEFYQKGIEDFYSDRNESMHLRPVDKLGD